MKHRVPRAKLLWHGCTPSGCCWNRGPNGENELRRWKKRTPWCWTRISLRWPSTIASALSTRRPQGRPRTVGKGVQGWGLLVGCVCCVVGCIGTNTDIFFPSSSSSFLLLLLSFFFFFFLPQPRQFRRHHQRGGGRAGMWV